MLECTALVTGWVCEHLTGDGFPLSHYQLISLVMKCIAVPTASPGLLDDEGKHGVGVVARVLLQIVNDSGKEMGLVGCDAWSSILKSVRVVGDSCNSTEQLQKALSTCYLLPAHYN